MDIARDSSSGTIYIADSNNDRIMCYNSGSALGTIAAGGNGAGTGSTQLNGPYGIYFDSTTNSLIIVNYLGNNVVRWVLGASSWTLIAGSASGAGGTSSIELNLPRDVTLDYMGNVYVIDTSNFRVQFFQAGQSNGTTIAGVTSISGTNATLLKIPYSLALDSQLNLYVADTYNDRIQKFLRY
jgi:tripartite motif-containing protein 71